MTNSITLDTIVHNGTLCSFMDIDGTKYLWDLINDLPYFEDNHKPNLHIEKDPYADS